MFVNHIGSSISEQPEVPETRLQSALNITRDRICQLQSAVEHLANRLEGVLQPSPPMPTTKEDAPRKVDSPCSPVVDSVQLIAQHIEKAANRIDELNARCEV